MTLKEALDIIRPQSENLDAIKSAYKGLLKKYHPDINPDGLKFAQLITEAKDFLIKAHKEGWFKESWSFASNAESTILNEMEEALSSLKGKNGLEVEICGTWLWIGGETKYWAKFLGGLKHKDERKMFSYAGKKQKWFWKPADYKKRSRRVWEMDEIRNSFGSRKFDNEEERSYMN
jgi:curved DNA-binding protein CbpA